VVFPERLVQGEKMELADDLLRVLQDMRLSQDIRRLLERNTPEQAASFGRLLEALDSIARLFSQKGDSDIPFGNALFLSYNLSLLRTRKYQRGSNGARTAVGQEAYERELNAIAERLGKISFALEHPETVKDLPEDAAEAVEHLLKQQHVFTEMLARKPLRGTLDQLEPVGDLKGQYPPRDWSDDPTQPTEFLRH
jgi:hypothetical protein